tara:strand:+ start:1148 stop:2416 length:1269 start_codon:yes stop_codon:yes gene_type:complete
MKLLNIEDFLIERYSSEGLHLLLEGGAAGHMMHPFDDNSLTFADFKILVDSALDGKLDFEEQPTEKTDGQNLLVTVRDGEVLFSRNKGQMVNPLTLDGIINMFKDHASEGVKNTFTLAAKDLAKALSSLKDISMFNNGKSFMNMELIYSANQNVINYDRDIIQFHGIIHTDGKGNEVSKDNKIASSLAKTLSDVNANIQDTFSIIPPQVLKIAKDINFDKRSSYYYKKINLLRDAYNLKDSDEVKMYHEAWWKEQIQKEFPNLTDELKEGLLKRWAYNDKKSLNMRSLAKIVDSSQVSSIKEYDKNSKKKWKENILPFENLFLELGSDVLKNVSNFVAANPEKEKQRLHTQIKKEAESIKQNGDISQITKVEKELKRLQGIGGIESIIPTEGLVFKYKGKMFKLTGTFAAINQLMGIIRYGR